MSVDAGRKQTCVKDRNGCLVGKTGPGVDYGWFIARDLRRGGGVKEQEGREGGDDWELLGGKFVDLPEGVCVLSIAKSKVSRFKSAGNSCSGDGGDGGDGDVGSGACL